MRSGSATLVPPYFWTSNATHRGYRLPPANPHVGTGALAWPAVPTEKRMRQREGRQSRQEELRRAEKQKQMRRRIIIGAGLGLLVVAAIFLTSRGGSKKKSDVSTTNTTAAPGATT